MGFGEQARDDSRGVREAPRVQHSRLGGPANDDCAGVSSASTSSTVMPPDALIRPSANTVTWDKADSCSV